MKHTSTNTTPYRFYASIILLLIISMWLYTFPDALDITRYYEAAKHFSLRFSNLADYIEYEYDNRIDFIYLSLLYLCQDIGLNMDYVTVFYMSLYYISICAIMRKYERAHIHGLLLFVALMCAPFCWVVSISRNLAAIATVYFAIYLLLSGKKKWGVVCLALAVFTHFSIILLLAVVIAAYLLKKLSISRPFAAFIFACVFILSFTVPSYLLDMVVFVAESSDNHYSTYADIEASAFMQNSYLGLGDKMPILFLYGFSIYLIFCNKVQDFFFWGLFILTSLLGFSLFTSTLFVQRISMMLPLFVGCNICSVYYYTPKSRFSLYVLSILGSLFILWNFWAYRLNYSI